MQHRCVTIFTASRVLDPSNGSPISVLEVVKLLAVGRSQQAAHSYLPVQYFQDGEKYDVVEVLKKCIKPKLVIYSTLDKLIDPQEVREVYEIFPEFKMIHEMECEHDYRYHADRIEEVHGVVGRFFIGILCLNL